PLGLRLHRMKTLEALRMASFPGQRTPCADSKPARFSIANITSDDVAKVLDVLSNSIESEVEKLKALEDLSKGDIHGASEHFKKALESKIQSVKNVVELGGDQLKKLEKDGREFLEKPVDKTKEIIEKTIPKLPKIKIKVF
ncbi:hypothetical protein, partial [Mesorhizobium sp. P17.1]|uniref:hypothetical protein n=1 Tax=Mesorhizobium sp. P17.1 TaxID=3033797 RepID=UPI0023DFE979